MGFSDWLNDLWIDKDNQAAGAAADAKNQELNKQLLDRGAMTPADYRVSQGDFTKSDLAMQETPFDAFNQSIKDSADSVKSSINGVAGGVLDFIPWWIKLGAVAFAGWYVYNEFFRRRA